AGACMIHLHVRDGRLGHSLDPTLYQQAIAAIRQRVGRELIIQITTEAMGIYSPQQQAAAVHQVRPEAVSLALREFCPDPGGEAFAAEFFNWLHQAGIYAQYILYDAADIARLKDLRRRGLIPGEQVAVLLVLGRYSKNLESEPSQLPPLVAAVEADWLWSACAFGRREQECMAAAISLGGHCRVGFENNLFLASGELAPDNAALVAAVRDQVRELQRLEVSADQAREMLRNTVARPDSLPARQE
ncbi:MAG: 3-keto-5-aminohexanoate cleavage protein, partial [Gammaproteobacteria bacterium]